MRTQLQAQSCWRVIPTRVPSADLFQGIADFGEWEQVVEIEGLFNERNRTTVGNLALVPPAHRAVGPGSSYLMAPFAYLSPGRFGDGSYGVLYAAMDEMTALVEVAYHRAVFLRDAGNGPETLAQQILTMNFSGEVEDIRGLQKSLPLVYDPASHLGGQAFAAPLQQAGIDGIAYSSVRWRGGECVAGFRPNAFSSCRHARQEQFYWDGQSLLGPAGIHFGPGGLPI
ncbi:MAG TPA: RES family NAD+ phosphorylase [Syntrophobacteraceae bacterium]|nr:RES family NAD+ phosphorylase [Syntrophobacteraceae bacterium]